MYETFTIFGLARAAAKHKSQNVPELVHKPASTLITGG